MDKWSIELTKSQLELVQVCVSIHADIMEEDIKAGKVHERDKDGVMQEIKDAMAIEAIAHLALVNLEAGEEAERQRLKKGGA